MDIYVLISLLYYYINKDVFRKSISEPKKKKEEEKVCLCIYVGVLSFCLTFQTFLEMWVGKDDILGRS